MSKNKDIRIAGFFSGTGGIEYGLKTADGFITAYANDFDSYPSETYALNFDESHYEEHLNQIKKTISKLVIN